MGLIEKFAYPDGSKKIISIQKTPYGIFTGKISGGTKNSGNGWYDWEGAKVSSTWGVVTASFYADFQGAKDLGKIFKVHTPSITVAGGKFRSERLSIVSPQATSSNPATAQLYFVGEGMNDIGSSTVYLTLRVPMNGNPTARMTI